jgi:hemerythrin-like domain-containing protein
MQPQESLVAEHLLINRMIALMKAAVDGIEAATQMDPAFIASAIDFIRVYADHTHHAKEEQILFQGLAAKRLAPHDVAMMRDLTAEHAYARHLTDELVEARNDYVGGDDEALGHVISLLMYLTDFYPRHIAKEDTEFFPVAMACLDESEREDMVSRFHAYDRSMIHEKYGSVVGALEVLQGRAGARFATLHAREGRHAAVPTGEMLALLG